MDENFSLHTRVTLKTVAEQVGLTAGTISAVLNNSRAAARIPQHTRERIFTAARELNYQPNALARALRTGKPVSAPKTDVTNAARALVIVDAVQLERALEAIQQAGLRVHDDFSVVDFGESSGLEYPTWGSVPDYPAMTSVSKPA